MDCPWIHETVENEKYAFAADYICPFVLYNEGGIYLDTDVEVRRSYNDLLSMPYFLGCESTTNIVEAATIGTEAHALLVKDVLDHYAGRHFVRLDGSLDTEPLPQIMRDTFQKIRGMKFISRPVGFDPRERAMPLLPVEYFSSKHWDSLEVYATKDTYSIHQFAGSWRPAESLNEKCPRKSRRRSSLCSVSRWYFGFIRSAVKLKLCFKNFKNATDL
jgi:hypothetical protein